MISRIKRLIVKYNGKVVGYLAELENSKIAFQYDERWLEEGFSISPFSLPLSREVFVNNKNTFNGLYGVFQDSLPDGWGELLFRRMMGRRGINPDRISPLTKLSLVSGNGLGALEYEPCQAENTGKDNIDFDEIAKETKQILSDESVNADLDIIYQLGGSSGGARPKVHIKDSEGFWIVKFPTGLDTHDVGEKEYNANKVAKECGINVNEFKLFPSKLCSGYFGAKRFDRNGGRRVHMISLSSLLETTHRLPNLDYMHLFQVIQGICVNRNDDMLEAYRRMCFNVLYGNRDDHGKNFSFICDEQADGYRLSPAYDITKTAYKPEHEMSVGGVGKPTEKDLIAAGESLGYNDMHFSEVIKRIKEHLV